MLDTIRLGVEGVDLDPGRLLRAGFNKLTKEQIDAEGLVHRLHTAIVQRRLLKGKLQGKVSVL